MFEQTFSFQIYHTEIAVFIYWETYDILSFVQFLERKKILFAAFSFFEIMHVMIFVQKYESYSKQFEHYYLNMTVCIKNIMKNS